MSFYSVVFHKLTCLVVPFLLLTGEKLTYMYLCHLHVFFAFCPMQLFSQHISLDFVICSSPVERDEIDELRVVLKISVIHINLVSSSLS